MYKTLFHLYELRLATIEKLSEIYLNSLFPFSKASSIEPIEEIEEIEEICEITIIKGNVNSKGKKIYHLPHGKFYERVKPIEVFHNEEEAKKAGYVKSSR